MAEFLQLRGNVFTMRVQLDATERPSINHSSEVEDLPWTGDLSTDQVLFDDVNAYIYSNTTSWAERLATLQAMGKHGLDIEHNMTMADVADCIRVAYDNDTIDFTTMMNYFQEIRKYVPLSYPVEQGQRIILRDTGETGVVTSGGKDADEPLIVNMGSNATLFPWIKITDHQEVRMEVYTNPDEAATDI